MERDDREILFGGYNARGQWVEGSACKDEDNMGWLILGPFMSEETSVEVVGNVYQYTSMDVNGQMVFDGSRIIGGYQWMGSDGMAQSQEIDDRVVWSKGSWVLESTGERLYDLLCDDRLYWDAKVIPPLEG